MTHHQKEKNSIASPQKAEMLELADGDVKRSYSYFQAFMGERWIELVSREGILAEKCKLFWQGVKCFLGT